MARNSRYNDRFEDYEDFDEYEERQRGRREEYPEDDYYADEYEDEYEGDYEEYDDRYEEYEDEFDEIDNDYYYEEPLRRSSASGRGRGSLGRGNSGRNTKKERGRGQKNSSKKTRRIILFAVEIVILLIVLGILYMATRVEKVEKAELKVEQIEETISEEVKQSTQSGVMKGYRNIALFGVDSTEGDLDRNTRSDSIIIASINQDTGDIKLVSVYRDTYLNLGNDSYNKCNAAYAKGGPEQAISMLNMNLDMNITDFVTVGFGGLMDVIDAVGGIDIDVDAAELQHINNYQLTMAQNLGLNGYTEVTSTGLQHLNGLQATAYCRIRYTNGWDYMRAARQREVLMATIEKAKTCSASSLISALDSIAPEIYTSLDITSDVPELIQNLTSYNIVTEDVSEMNNGFPNNDMRTSGNLGSALGDCVVPRDLESNVIWLHELLFDDPEYEPSSTVKSISQKIASDTASLP